MKNFIGSSKLLCHKTAIFGMTTFLVGFIGTLSVEAEITGCDLNTVLLLHLNGNDGDTTTTDEDCDDNGAHSITLVDNVHLEDTQKKFGTTSMRFDGVGDYLTLPNHVDFKFGSGDFTIDWWEYKVTNTNNDFLIVGDGTETIQ